MRIAMLGHKRMPSREGGVEVVVTELSTRMAALGHDVTVYSRGGKGKGGNAGRIAEYKGVKVLQAPTVDIRGIAALTSSYSAARAAAADRPDVIHFHAEGPCAMIPIAKRAGIRTVATIHGLDWQRAKWGRAASGYIRRGEAIAAREADEVIVLSESARDYFEREYGRETALIPNGVDPKPAPEPCVIASKHGLSKGGYVLYLGRIVPEKGLHYLLEAFAGVATGKRLVVAGGPSDSQAYYGGMRRAAAADPRVVFTGFVEGRELAELYGNCALFVLPSDLEGMPMSLLEAMSYGCCCLTSDIPECAGVLGGCGATFRRGDPADLARKLSALLGDAAAGQELGECARRLACDRYGWDGVVEQTLEVYGG